MNNFSPIIIFTFNRLNTLVQTIDALKLNYGANQSDLYIFSDAPKNIKDEVLVLEVRKYLRTIKGFKNVTIVEAKQNKGLANSIIDGVTEVINIYGRVIVLEDDLISSYNFLTFMNNALDKYANEPKLFSISGFSMPIKGLNFNETYFTQRSSSWGWGTWKDRWMQIEWEVNDYDSFKNDKERRRHFNKMGSDMSYMLDRQMKKKINSWAIRWCYHQFKQNTFTLFPSTSKIQNIGIENSSATHTNEKYNRFKTILDVSFNLEFEYPSEIVLQPQIIIQFIKPYSIPQRIKYKLFNILF